MLSLLAAVGLWASPSEQQTAFTTNYPAVFAPRVLPYVTYLTNHYPARSNQTIGRTRVLTNTILFTNQSFSHYVPGSFPEQIWTNFIARTNGKSTRLWVERSRPQGWPESRPVIKWNRDSVVFGLRGFTALSPCWEGEGSAGQVPITALTRRHGYTRGHGMGQSGMSQRFAGKRVWFLTAHDKLIEVRIEREVVRVPFTDKRDYTILLFDRDLPKSIEPLPVADPKHLGTLYPYVQGGPRPLFETEQSGHVSTGTPGLSVNTWKGGDSGSPNMVLLGNQLIFVNGRSTSGPSLEMQSDMESLCVVSGLQSRKYQMRWVSLLGH